MSALSLRKRLLLAASVILVTFLGLAGFVLDKAFVSSAEFSLQNQLHNQAFALLSVLELEPDGDFVMPELVPDARLMVPYSGLSAFIINQDRHLVWQSVSSLGEEFPRSIFEPAEMATFSRTSDAFSGPFQYILPITWETEEGLVQRFTLVLHETGDQFVTSVANHQNKIILWLGLVGAFLLFTLMLALRWSLAPLQRVRQEIDQVESGQQEGITGHYPTEISQLSERINQFIRNERANLIRHKNTLADLAHSLKTPLTVIQGMAEGDQPVPARELAEYVGQMRNIVNYQLNRAGPSHLTLIHNQVDMPSLVDRVFRSLEKVYVDHDLQFQSTVTPKLKFDGDESDLMEILGNLLDNACKWARSTVYCKITLSENPHTEHHGIRIVIEDDGPGIDPENRAEVLRRGVRVGQRRDGQGIGLSVCQEIVDAYRGNLMIGDSAYGGAAVTVTLRNLMID